MNKRLSLLVITSIIYFCLIQTGIGYFIVAPIDIFVAFMHEAGHGTMCLLTGGKVESLVVNLDGSGVTHILGGYYPLVLMGGYIGSCVFSNLLMRYSTTSARLICNMISISAIFCATMLYENTTTSVILTGYAIAFFFIGRFPFSTLILQFIGVACVVDVLRDFDIGPSSDLNEFKNSVGIFSQNVWMYIWLAICIVVTYFNMKQIVKRN